MLKHIYLLQSSFKWVSGWMRRGRVQQHSFSFMIRVLALGSCGKFACLEDMLVGCGSVCCHNIMTWKCYAQQPTSAFQMFMHSCTQLVPVWLYSLLCLQRLDVDYLQPLFVLTRSCNLYNLLCLVCWCPWSHEGCSVHGNTVNPKRVKT